MGFIKPLNTIINLHILPLYFFFKNFNSKILNYVWLKNNINHKFMDDYYER